ncbi:MAG: ATP synthase subunit I [Deltaproteobacteria bacterium]|nr:ATP synthase subunit I [Deltaproteobacteria bacterium]
MESFRRYKKIILFEILITILLVATVLSALSLKTQAAGFVLGSLFSALNLQIMAWTLPQRLFRSSRKAGIISGLNLLPRLFILGLPLVIAVYRPEKFNLIFTIIGLFNLQFSILVNSLVIERYGILGSAESAGK